MESTKSVPAVLYNVAVNHPGIYPVETVQQVFIPSTGRCFDSNGIIGTAIRPGNILYHSKPNGEIVPEELPLKKILIPVELLEKIESVYRLQTELVEKEDDLKSDLKKIWG